jgi:uncharacterized membrane protein YtjA (UPF0391 family)
MMRFEDRIMIASFLFEHDLRANTFGVCRKAKPASTFPDHAPAVFWAGLDHGPGGYCSDARSQGVGGRRHESRFRAADRILFPRNIGILCQQPSGTFVPPSDCIRIRCATIFIALFETESGNRGRAMLSWVVTFLVVALIAGVLGFGGVAGVSIEIAKAIFFIAIVLFLVSAVVGLVRGRGNV